MRAGLYNQLIPEIEERKDKDLTRYDPKVYDPKKRLGDDAAVMEGFSLCGQMVLDWLDETAEGMTAYGGVPIFDVIYSQVAHDIRQHVADLLDGRRVELTVGIPRVR